MASILAPLLDFALAFVILIGMIVWYGITPGWALLALPLFIMLAVLTALAMGLFLAGLNVRYRDVGHAIPFLVQLWMFASPVAFPGSASFPNSCAFCMVSTRWPASSKDFAGPCLARQGLISS